MSTTKDNLPGKLIRGISSKNHIKLTSSGKTVFLDAFQFTRATERNDGFEECSINWEDDDKAMDFTLCQKNEIGELRFPAGLTKIKRNELDLQFGGFKETFGYERRAIEGNIYHGNLLLLAKEEKPTKKMIRSALAVLAKKEIIERN